MQAINALAWHDTFSGLQAGGFGFFDFTTAIDQGEQLMVIARVANLESREAVLLWTTVRRAPAHPALARQDATGS